MTEHTMNLQGGWPRRGHVILTELAAAGERGGTSSDLALSMTVSGQPFNWHRTRNNEALRKLRARECVRRAARREMGPAQTSPGMYRWYITEAGLRYLDWLNAVPGRQALQDTAVNISQQIVKARKDRLNAILQQAETIYGPWNTPAERRVVAVQLRDHGCTLQSIADVFGVTRESIRLDLKRTRAAA
jgi:hypothetical protein